MSHKPTGKVYLVGAGPGDPELLTLKAKRLLEMADVVLYDYLAPLDVLGFCKKDCLKLSVGKRKGFHKKKQSEINTLLCTHAKKGANVVRLKGGDPNIFGRMGEEMAILRDENIPFEVVPGVSSVLAVPSYAGIPLTFRDVSRSVGIISGTLSDMSPMRHIPNVDTLLVVMAVIHLEDIIEVIRKSGHFSESTPVALIYSGTTAKQKVIYSTVSDIAKIAQENHITPPALLICGEVVQYGQSFDWTSHLPLFGQRVILLRTREQSHELDKGLTALGAEVLHLPLLAFEPEKTALKKISTAYLESFDTLVFTSPNGVKYFMSQLYQQHYDARVLKGKTIFVIGPKTSETLKGYGIVPNDQPDQYHSEALLHLFPKDLKGRHILFPVAKGADTTLPLALEKRGAQIEILKIYRTILPETQAFSLSTSDKVVFTSSSTALHFFEHSSYHGEGIQAICIGEKTANTVRKYLKKSVYVAKEATSTALIEAIRNSGDTHP